MLKCVSAGLRSFITALPNIGAVLMRDLSGLAGVGAIAYGGWLIYPPAGYIAGGTLLLAGALLTARR